MNRFRFFPLLLAGLLLACGGALRADAPRVTALRCEYRVNPLGIDALQPRLSWELQTRERGQRQSAYQVLVAATQEQLSRDQGDLWNSGRVQSGQSAQVKYGGKPLRAWMHAYWKVRVWDRCGVVSPWSAPAQWMMGPLHEADWQGARWIGATTAAVPPGPVNGYHAAEAKQDGPKWVQVDLGRVLPLDTVRLYPAHPNNFSPDTPGFGFPRRFQVTAGTDPAMKGAVTLADYTAEDFPNPGDRPVTLAAHSRRARYLRVTATHPWRRQDGCYCFALSELEAVSGNKNVALGAPVTAADSVENFGWGRAALTDGRSPALANDGDPAYAAPLLRRRFQVTGPVRRATVTLCGLGYYELFLNGQRVGDHQLDPGFTRYDRRALYVTYDVTPFLRPGENVVGVRLGGGWYRLAIPDLFGFEAAPWTASPKLRLLLRAERTDGSVQQVASDRSWQWATGAIRFQCLRGGETHDQRLARPDWCQPGATGAGWQPVKLVAAPAGKLSAQKQPPIKTAGTIPAVAITTPRPGVYVFKLAENTAGWVRFRVSGQPGQKITLRCNEALGPDGALSDNLTSHTHGRYQTDEIILRGKGVEIFEPRFTYHGFQYVLVEGLTYRPALTDLVGVRVHTALAPAGSFACGNETINAIQRISLRTYLNNLHSIPTDCPHREKMGWLADGAVASEMAMCNFDAAALYTKWVEDMRDEQAASGSMPAFVPTAGWGSEGQPSFKDWTDAWWGGATVIVPWNLYRYYGDTGLLRQHYPAMKRFVDYLTSISRDSLITTPLGDWLAPEPSPKDEIASAGYFHFARIVSRTAAILGKKEDAAAYARLAERIRDAFNTKFFDTTTDRYRTANQTIPAMALVFGLAPDGKRDAVLQALAENIERRNGHISSGIVGTSFVLAALHQCGRDDLAYRMVTVPTFPGYVHMLANGSTTVWESWDGGGSHDHPALGVVSAWFYQALAGIEATAPGFKTIRIRPALVGDIPWARAAYHSLYGTVVSDWKRQGKVFTLHVAIPANTTATVYVPASDAATVREGTRPAAQAAGVRFLRQEAGYTVYAVASGEYRFRATLDK